MKRWSGFLSIGLLSGVAQAEFVLHDLPRDDSQEVARVRSASPPM
jgi:hypothetical protein